MGLTVSLVLMVPILCRSTRLLRACRAREELLRSRQRLRWWSSCLTDCCLLEWSMKRELSIADDENGIGRVDIDANARRARVCSGKLLECLLCETNLDDFWRRADWPSLLRLRPQVNSIDCVGS